MSSELSKAVQDVSPVSEGRAWSRPAFSRLETGDAAGNDSIGADGGQVS